MANSKKNSMELMSKIATIGVAAADDNETRIQKAISNFSLLFGAIPVQLFLAVVYFGFDENLTAGILAASSGGTAVLVILHGFHKTNYQLFKFVTLATAYISPFLATLLLGGIVNGSFVIMWGLVGPMFALALYRPRQAAYWFLLFCVLVSISVVVQPYLRPANNIPIIWQSILAAFNGIAISGMVFGALLFLVLQRNAAYGALNVEKGKAEELLLNILPREIAEFLKNEPKVFADNYAEASILFADAVNFTSLSAGLKPLELVEILNEVFTYFDDLVDKYGLEKIKTIGDCYMVASGIPRARKDHATALASMAIEMQNYVEKHQFGGMDLKFRIGINSGPVVAGVIGRKKFIYDLWGEAVNLASRMESQGEAGKIQITRSTFELIKDGFICEPMGTVYVKGKGETDIWHLKATKVSSVRLGHFASQA